VKTIAIKLVQQICSMGGGEIRPRHRGVGGMARCGRVSRSDCGTGSVAPTRCTTAFAFVGGHDRRAEQLMDEKGFAASSDSAG